jgi:hypothetical protein
MKSLILVAVAVLGLVGCGEKKSDGNTNGAVPNGNPYGYNANVCPNPGQVPTQAGCLDQGFCPPGQGQYNGQCLQSLVGQQYGGYNGIVPPGGYYQGNYQSNPNLGYPPGYGYGYQGSTGFYWYYGNHPGFYSYY